MSLLVTDILQPNSGQNLNIDSNVNVIGFLSAQTIYSSSNNFTRTINEAIPSGSAITSVNTYLQYGINVIYSANTTNFCLRLPEIPIEGREVIIINRSNFDIFIYPSVDGGSIDGLLNGSTSIPPDGKSYKFICYENPNPGLWSSNILAAPGQYDSGVISIDTSQSFNSFGYVSAFDNNFKHNHYSVFSTNFLNSKNAPYVIYNPNPLGCGSSSGNCLTVWFKPTTPWLSIDKITLYTNFGSTIPSFGGPFFSISATEETGYYDATTGAYLATQFSSGNNYEGTPGSGVANQIVPGTPVFNSNGFSANPGDSGTLWGELIYNTNDKPSQIGDNFIATGSFSFTDWFGNPQNLTNADKYYSRYISFFFQGDVNSPDVKFRFIIDYTV